MSAVPPLASPPGSMAGYSWREYLRRNKGDLKLIISAASGVAAWWLSQRALDQALAAGIGTLASVAAHMLASAVDYWLTDQSAPAGGGA